MMAYNGGEMVWMWGLVGVTIGGRLAAKKMATTIPTTTSSDNFIDGNRSSMTDEAWHRERELNGGGHGHFFVKKTFHKPTYCHHCTDMLWGLIGQGYVCEGKNRCHCWVILANKHWFVSWYSVWWNVSYVHVILMFCVKVCVVLMLSSCPMHWPLLHSMVASMCCIVVGSNASSVLDHAWWLGDLSRFLFLSSSISVFVLPLLFPKISKIIVLWCSVLCVQYGRWC